VNHRAEVTRRRGERIQQQAVRDAAAASEAEEIALAIAELEEFERNQVAVREAERRRREREEREEEELLAKLEAMSLEEEMKRQEAEALAEKQQLEVLHASVIDLAHSLQQQLQSLVSFQQRTLISRHESQETALKETLDLELATQLNEQGKLLAMLTSNADKRRKAMIQRHERDAALLQSEHEKREDDIFLEMLAYLRDKQNSEEREQRMKNDFRRQLDEEREQHVVRHSVERTRFEAQFQQEMQGLEYAHESGMHTAKDKHEKEMRYLSGMIDGERQYFDFITRRRTKLMALHGSRLVADLEQSREPQGLTRGVAIANLMPFSAAGQEVESLDKATVDVPQERGSSPLSDLEAPQVSVPGVGWRWKALSEESDDVENISSKRDSSPPSELEAQRVSVPGVGWSRPSRSEESASTPASREADSTKAASIRTVTSSKSGDKKERRRSSIWLALGRSKRSSKQKYTDDQVKETLATTVGGAF
jgi:hypothetical protein